VVLGGEIRSPLDDARGLLACRANLKGFAFEYMTAGRVLVLGDPGPWICAGMTGGVVYLRLNPEMGLDVAAIRRRIAQGARVELGKVSARDEDTIFALLDAYASALRDSDQGPEAERVAAFMDNWASRFVKIVAAGQLLDQEISTE